MRQHYEKESDREAARREMEKYVSHTGADFDEVQPWLDKIISHDFVVIDRGTKQITEYTEVKVRRESAGDIIKFGGTVILEQIKMMQAMLLTKTNPHACAAFLVVLGGDQYVIRYRYSQMPDIDRVEWFTRRDRPNESSPVVHIPLESFIRVDMPETAVMVS